MELSQNSARDMLAPLLENSMMLPRDIFDYQNKMHADVSAFFKRCLPFIKQELLSFIKADILDVVCFGAVCSGIHHSNSPIFVAIILKTNLEEAVLKRISSSLVKRGYVFKLYNHQVFFELQSQRLEEPNWSVMYGKWNVAPVFKKFEFDVDFLMAEYVKLNDDFHVHLDDLEKNEAGFYTPQSCEVIKQYFLDFEQKSQALQKTDPFCLEGALLQALDVFGVRQHFQKEIIKSECYYLSGAVHDKI